MSTSGTGGTIDPRARFEAISSDLEAASFTNGVKLKFQAGKWKILREGIDRDFQVFLIKVPGTGTDQVDFLELLAHHYADTPDGNAQLKAKLLQTAAKSAQAFLLAQELTGSKLSIGTIKVDFKGKVLKNNFKATKIAADIAGVKKEIKEEDESPQIQQIRSCANDIFRDLPPPRPLTPLSDTHTAVSPPPSPHSSTAVGFNRGVLSFLDDPIDSPSHSPIPLSPVLPRIVQPKDDRGVELASILPEAIGPLVNGIGNADIASVRGVLAYSQYRTIINAELRTTSTEHLLPAVPLVYPDAIVAVPREDSEVAKFFIYCLGVRSVDQARAIIKDFNRQDDTFYHFQLALIRTAYDLTLVGNDLDKAELEKFLKVERGSGKKYPASFYGSQRSHNLLPRKNIIRKLREGPQMKSIMEGSRHMPQAGGYSFSAEFRAKLIENLGKRTDALVIFEGES